MDTNLLLHYILSQLEINDRNDVELYKEMAKVQYKQHHAKDNFMQLMIDKNKYESGYMKKNVGQNIHQANFFEETVVKQDAASKIER